MKRINRMGLLAIMALTLLAAAVPATASARSGFEVGEYPATVSGELGPGYAEIMANGASWSCSGMGFGAQMKTPAHILVPSSSEDGACESGKQSATLAVNSCRFEFTTGSEGEGPGTVAIGPSGCGAMTYNIGTSCVFSIAPQSSTNVEFKNTEGHVTISLNTVGLSYTRTKGTVGECGSAQGTLYLNAADWQVEAFNKASEAVDFQVTDGLPPVGIFLTGSQLAAESYPTLISGDQDAEDPMVWNWGGGTLECELATLFGSLSGATATVSLEAQYGDGENSGCTWYNAIYNKYYLTAVHMNSCNYVVHVGASSPPYTGTIDVLCEKEGDAIEVLVEAGETCTFTVAPQTGLKGIALETVGSGSNRKVVVDFNKVVFKAKRTVGTLFVCGTKEQEPSYNGSTALSGSY